MSGLLLITQRLLSSLSKHAKNTQKLHSISDDTLEVEGTVARKVCELFEVTWSFA